MSPVKGCRGPACLFVFVHPCWFRHGGHGSGPFTASSVACANLLTCRPSPPATCCPFYPPATLCSSSKRERKKPYLILKHYLAKWNAPSFVRACVCVCWPSFFYDCLFVCVCLSLCVYVCVCLSDCFLVPCFTVPLVIGNLETNGCWTDCLFAVQQNASGVNRDFTFFFFWWSLVFVSFRKLSSKCFCLVVILFMPSTKTSKS